MEKPKITPEDILKLIINKAITMNMVTERNKELEDKIKIAQKATSLTILEPAFDYMEDSNDEKLKLIAKGYKKHINSLKKHGILEVVNEDEIKKILA